jgi:hypothetical protein
MMMNISKEKYYSKMAKACLIKNEGKVKAALRKDGLIFTTENQDMEFRIAKSEQWMCTQR